MTAAAGSRAPARLNRISLRTKLIAILIGLLFVCCAALTLITSLALHAYLVNRLDQQLSAAGNRYAVSLEHPGDGDADDGNFSSVIGQQVGTLGARVSAGVVTAAGVISNESETRAVSAADRSVLAGLTVGGPRDVQLPDLGEYRVQVVTGRDHDEQVTGLPTRAVDETLSRLTAIEISVFVAALLLTGLAGAVCIRLALRPLERVSRTAHSVTELPLGSGHVQLPERLVNPAPGTEVGQVTEAVNQMLGHVEAAFAERQATENVLRHFIADASHELRTPIAVIRSHAEYLELTGRSFTADAADALGRIGAEADRMGLLIEDLLLLARLDAGRPLAREPVDLTRLLLDGVMDARAVGPDHEWTLDLPDHEILVTGDANSLHQVVLNLLGNSVAHTPAGTAASVRLTTDGRDAIAVVSDDGPGIPSDFLPQVFERFAQANRGRAHRGGQSGLGLAIVESIVAAHQGTVDVISRPGSTVFTVRLPLAEPLVQAGSSARTVNPPPAAG